MDSNQQELESLEKRKIEIPSLSSHPSYIENGDDAIVDFSVDDIYDSFKKDVAKVRPVTKASKVIFECDELINIDSGINFKKQEEKQTLREPEIKTIETVEVIKPIEIERKISTKKIEEKETQFLFSSIPLFLFKGKLNEGDEPIYDSAFRSDSEIAAIENKEQEKLIVDIKKEPLSKPEPLPENPELTEVKSYLSKYPIKKKYRGIIISNVNDEFIPKDSFVNPDVLDEILGRSKEIAIEKAKREVVLEFGKDAEDKDLFNYAKAPLASQTEIEELESKHMALYSSISRIQEIQSANDFKSAYQIQDRISYLLNHRTLLYKSLTQELIKFVDSITKRLDFYYEQASNKYAELKVYNQKISGIKNYKWRSDESMKIIKENKESAQKELERI